MRASAGIFERGWFVLRLVCLPMCSVTLFGMLLGVSIVTLFFGRTLEKGVAYIVPGGLVLVGWGLFHALIFLGCYALAQRRARREGLARLGAVLWARQAWWREDGRRVLGLVGVGPDGLRAVAFDNAALSCDFPQVRALELLPAQGALQILLGHGTLRVFGPEGETWDALVCGSARALPGLRRTLGLAEGTG